MKIYNIDGTVRKSTDDDNQFGWVFKDITVDENVENYQELNIQLRKGCRDMNKLRCEVNIELLEPEVELAGIKSTQNTILIDQIRSYYFNPYVNEVTNSDEYINFVKQSIDLMQQGAKSISITDSKSRYKYNRDKINNLKVYTDNEKDKDVSMRSGPKYNKVLDARKCKKQAEKFRSKTSDMHFQLTTVRNQFKMEETKIEKLLQEAINLRQDILECNFLDEMIILLMGEPERLKSKHWPFKLANDTENNLII